MDRWKGENPPPSPRRQSKSVPNRPRSLMFLHPAKTRRRTSGARRPSVPAVDANSGFALTSGPRRATRVRVCHTADAGIVRRALAYMDVVAEGASRACGRIGGQGKVR